MGFWTRLTGKLVRKNIQHNQQAQLSHQTRENRFPKIFDTIKALKPTPSRVLSFGCSTGEECHTLASIYPDAEIVGVDIDINSVRVARRNNKNSRVFFLDDVGGTGKYDVVTCIMVLFGMYDPPSMEVFDGIVSRITDHLKPGALFCVYSSEYSLLDSSVGKHYSVVRQWMRDCPQTDKKYYCGYYLFSS